MLNKITRLEINLIVFGSLALLIALFIYPRFQPDFNLELPLSETEIEQRAADLLSEYSIHAGEKSPKITLDRNQPYFRRYVQNYGKSSIKQHIQHPDRQSFFYNWNVSFNGLQQEDSLESDITEISNFELSLSLKGDLLSLAADSLSIFAVTNQSSADQAFLDRDSLFYNELIKPILNASYWKQTQNDSIRFETTTDGDQLVSLYHSNQDLDFPVSIETVLTGSGKLVSISYSLTQELESRSVAETGFEIATAVFGIIIFIFITVLFFNRQFNRLIDMRLVQFDAAAVGLLVLLGMAINMYPEMIADADEITIQVWLQFILVPLLIASLMAGLSFVVIGTADSLNEEAWPVKKHAITLIRHGFIKNDIVGGGLLRGVFAGFLMFGLSALLFIIIGSSWHAMSDASVFLTDANMFAIFDRFSTDLLFTFVFVVIFLMTPAAYLRIKKLNIWLIFSIVLVIGSLFSSKLPKTGNEFIDFFISLVVFSVPVWMYLKYDTLSALTTVFVYSITTGTLTILFTPSLNDVTLFIYWIVVISVILLVAYIGLKKDDDLSEMPDLVPEYLKRLAREQRIEQEFSLAREVHEQFLTSAQPNISDYDIAANCKTAYEVGGDYYDFITLDDHRTLVVIADVSGKGVKAAFYMTLLKGYLQSVSEQHKSVSDIMKTANRLFYENSTRGTFITALAGILDTKTNTFEFVRAGHDPLFLIDGNDMQCRELIPKGFALGMAKPDVFNTHVEVAKITLREDQTIILFTDGYPESHNIGKEQLGEDGLKNIAIKNETPEITAADLLNSIHQDVISFVGKAHQHDDMTMIVIRRNKN